MAFTENAFEIGGKCGIADLVSAVMICSHDWQDGLRMLNEDTSKEVKAWHDSIYYERRFFGLVKTIRDINWVEKLELFREYYQDAHSHSCYVIENSVNPKGTEIPLTQLVRFVLVSKFGYDAEKVWNTPWKLALMDYLTFQESEGRIHLEDRDDNAEIQKKLAAFNERMKGVCLS